MHLLKRMHPSAGLLNVRRHSLTRNMHSQTLQWFHSPISHYHSPSTQMLQALLFVLSMIERFNRTRIDQLAKMLLQQPGEWDDCLDLVYLAYNTSRHSTTGFTPFFLTNGHEARMPANVLLPKNMPSSSTPGSPADYVAQLTLMWIFPGVTYRIHYLLDQSDKSQTIQFSCTGLWT